MAIGRINATLTGVQPGGLAKIVPTSVAVGSGSGSVDSNGNVTFSGVSSISLNGCFTSSYDNYKLVCEVTSASANADMQSRYRLNGTDASANSYSTQYLLSSSTTVSGATVNTTYMDFGSVSTNTRYMMTLDFIRPFTTGQHLAQSNIFYLSSSSNWVMRVSGHRYDVATAYDSFSIFPASGTITGTLRIYGYN